MELFYAKEANGRMHVMFPKPSAMSICVSAKLDVVTHPDLLRAQAEYVVRALNYYHRYMEAAPVFPQPGVMPQPNTSKGRE